MRELVKEWIFDRLASGIEKLPKKDRATPLKIFLAISGSEAMYQVVSNRRTVAEALGTETPDGQGFFRIDDFWRLLETLEAPAMEQAIRRFCAAAFRYDASLFDSTETVESLCGLLGVDLHRDYVPAKEVLDLYPLAMLVLTPAAERIEADDADNFAELAASKETLIPALIAEWTPGEMPPGLD